MIRFGLSDHSFHFLLESKTMRCTTRTVCRHCDGSVAGRCRHGDGHLGGQQDALPATAQFQWLGREARSCTRRCAGRRFPCTETGPIGGIHFWQSWQGDHFGAINSIGVGIFSNNPMGAYGWSEPDQMLWGEHFDPIDIGFGATSTGDQGWFDPSGYEPGGAATHSMTTTITNRSTSTRNRTTRLFRCRA